MIIVRPTYHLFDHSLSPTLSPPLFLFGLAIAEYFSLPLLPIHHIPLTTIIMLPRFLSLVGLAIAEYFRDQEGQDVLLFVDNIFRFTQVGEKKEKGGREEEEEE